MANLVVVGAQWGDEGKAKIVDYLTRQVDVVVRFQGGANAGHTVWVKDKKFVFHLIPAGIMVPGKICVIGNGVMVDIESLLNEIRQLQKVGVRIENRLFISASANVVLPYHKFLDQYYEDLKGKNKIGTTVRGIGPAYTDKIARLGVRITDLYYQDILAKKLQERIRMDGNLLPQLLHQHKTSLRAIIKEFTLLGTQVKPYLRDTSLFLHQCIRQGKSILFEGAQGTILDVDHGTYPYVTSSNTIAGAACTGGGIGPTQIDQVIGVCKAYSTRVGNGPFPTELGAELGAWIRKKGNEYGATTGRPRRCGWLDTVMLRYAVRVNDLTSMALTKLDTLQGISDLKISVAYRLKNKILREFPTDPEILKQCEPVYRTFSGWDKDISSTRTFAQLPATARRYIRFIEEQIQIPVSIISVGQERDQTLTHNAHQ